MKVPKPLLNIILSVFALLVIFVGGGAAYVWYNGQYSNENPAVIARPLEPPAPRTIKPTKPAPGAKVNASVQSITSPVTPGSNASITVKTNAESSCTISVIYDKTASTDSGLHTKVADEFGIVSWTWTVGPSVPTGKWPVKVTCANEKQSAVVVGDLVVAN